MGLGRRLGPVSSRVTRMRRFALQRCTRRLREARVRGFTLVELVVALGIVGLLVAVAIQSILRARSTTNEATAIGNLHALASMLHTHHSINNVFPSNWQADMYDNVDPDYGPPSFNMSMTNSLFQGYLYTYTAQPSGCATGCTGYFVTANPQSLGSLGTRAFFLDNTGRVRHCTGSGPAEATDALVTDPPADC